jgi:phosphatidylglycerophosphatase A
MNYIHKIIATSFGLGYIPWAPGTFGALLGALLVWIIHTLTSDVLTTTLIIIGLSIITYIIGVWSTKKLSTEWGDDPSKVVMDETCGMLITMIAVDFSWMSLTLGFILFRFFDILKPLGIRKLDNMKGAHYVMLDDVLAGIYANVVLQLILRFI